METNDTNATNQKLDALEQQLSRMMTRLPQILGPIDGGSGGPDMPVPPGGGDIGEGMVSVPPGTVLADADMLANMVDGAVGGRLTLDELKALAQAIADGKAPRTPEEQVIAEIMKRSKG